MDKMDEIMVQLRKDAKKYHHQFELLDYIEVKGLKALLTPFINQMAAENIELQAKINNMMDHHNNTIDLTLNIQDKLNTDIEKYTAKNDRVCSDCGYGCHVLDIPFMEGECPVCSCKEFKEVTYTERIESELKNARTEGLKLASKLFSFGESSSDLKAKFIGEFFFETEEFDEDECEVMVKRFVPWILQKQIFKEMSEYVKNRKDEDIRP